MHLSHRRAWIAALAASMAVAAIVLPASSAVHALDHLGIGFDAHVATDAAPGQTGGEAEPEADCDVCQALSGTRVALTHTPLALGEPAQVVERLTAAPTQLAHAWAHWAPAAPRAPPLG